MKIPSFKPPTPGDYPGLGEEHHGALKVVSDQLELLTQCLQSNVSAEDNSNVEMKTVDLQNGVEVEIELTDLKGTPAEVTVVSYPVFATESLYWTVVDQGKIRVRIDFTPGEGVTLPRTISTTLMIRGPSE